MRAILGREVTANAIDSNTLFMGLNAVDAGRRARTSITDTLRTELGQAKHGALVDGLQAVSDATGALDQLLQRRTRPEDSR